MRRHSEPAPARLSTRADFEVRWSGRLLLAARRAGVLGRESKFDVSWFVPAILEYKRLFAEVLIASSFL